MSATVTEFNRDTVGTPPVQADPLELQENKQFVTQLVEDITKYITTLNDARLDAFTDRKLVTNVHYTQFDHPFPTTEFADFINQKTLENWDAILGHALTKTSDSFLKLSPTISPNKDQIQYRVKIPFTNASLNINRQSQNVTAAFKVKGYDKQLFLTASIPGLIETPGQISLTSIKLDYPSQKMYLEFSLEKRRDSTQAIDDYPSITTISESIEAIRERLSAQQIFEYCLFVSGERETIFIQNENTEFVTEIFSPFTANSIPNQYGVWVTRNDQIATQLQVTDPLENPKHPNTKEAGYMLGYPTPSIEQYYEYSELEFKQQTVHMLSDGDLSEDERRYLHLIQYTPAPTKESIRRAIELGKQHQDSVKQFDSTHNTDIGRYAITKQVERGFEKWKKAFK